MGEFSLRPENEVTAGEAAGFDFISYVALVDSFPDHDQEIFEIESDGRTFLELTDNDTTVATRVSFLPDAELFQVRTNFAESGFFEAEGTYGNLGDTPQATLVYQVDGLSQQITRRGEVPVGMGPDSIPPLIDRLFDQVELLVAESRVFGLGTAVPLRPLVDGQTTRIDRRQFEVVRSREALLDLLWRMGSIEVSVLPNVDFSRETVVCAFLGSQVEHGSGQDVGRTGAIAFRSAFEFEGVLQVEFERRDYHGPCGDPVQPFALARVPRSDLPVRFFEATEPGEPISCGP